MQAESEANSGELLSERLIRSVWLQQISSCLGDPHHFHNMSQPDLVFSTFLHVMECHSQRFPVGNKQVPKVQCAERKIHVSRAGEC